MPKGTGLFFGLLNVAIISIGYVFGDGEAIAKQVRDHDNTEQFRNACDVVLRSPCNGG